MLLLLLLLLLALLKAVLLPHPVLLQADLQQAVLLSMLLPALL